MTIRRLRALDVCLSGLLLCGYVTMFFIAGAPFDRTVLTAVFVCGAAVAVTTLPGPSHRRLGSAGSVIFAGMAAVLGILVLIGMTCFFDPAVSSRWPTSLAYIPLACRIAASVGMLPTGVGSRSA